MDKPSTHVDHRLLPLVARPIRRLLIVTCDCDVAILLAYQTKFVSDIVNITHVLA